MFQPGMYFNASDAAKVMVYVHNAYQECHTLSSNFNKHDCRTLILGIVDNENCCFYAIHKKLHSV